MPFSSVLLRTLVFLSSRPNSHTQLARLHKEGIDLYFTHWLILSPWLVDQWKPYFKPCGNARKRVGMSGMELGLLVVNGQRSWFGRQILLSIFGVNIHVVPVILSTQSGDIYERCIWTHTIHHIFYRIELHIRQALVKTQVAFLWLPFVWFRPVDCWLCW